MFEQKRKPTTNPFGGGSGEKQEEFKIIGKKKDPKIKEMIEKAREKKKALKPRSICGC